MIQQLIRFYDNFMPEKERIPYGYADKNITFALNIDEDGQVLNIVPTVNLVAKEKPVPVMVPDTGKPESSGAVARFLWGKFKYMFKLSKHCDNDKCKFFDEQKKLHLDLLSEVAADGNKAALAVCRYFENAQVREFTEEETLLYEKGGPLFAFKFNGEYLFTNKEICSKWDKYMAEGEQGCSAFSGEYGKVLDGPHPQFTVPGTGAGSALVSRKEDVASFQMEMPLPVITQGDAHKYASALKFLVTKKEIRVREIKEPVKTSKGKKAKNKKAKDGVVPEEIKVQAKKTEYPYFYYRTLIADDFCILHWAENINPVDFNPFFNSDNVFDNNKDDRELKAVFERACSGLGFEVGKDNPVVHVYGIVGMTGRIRVLFSAHEFLNDMIENALAHQERMRLVGLEKIPSFYSVLRLVLPEGGNANQYHNLAQGMALSIMTGCDYPDYMYNAVLEKIKTGLSAGQFGITSYAGVNCVALLKAALIKNFNLEVGEKMNELETNVAYLLGRAYAAAWLYVDKDHRGNMTKVMERWYRVAVESPAMAYAQYLQSARIHGVSDYKVAEILKGINEPFPERLNTKEQGLWTLGFYHEVAKIFKIGEPKEKKAEENVQESTVEEAKED